MRHLALSFIALLSLPIVQAADVAVPSGTTVTVRTIDAIDSKSAEVGKTYRASLDAPLIISGKEVAAKGSDASLRVIEATSAGKIQGKAQLTVTLVNVTAGGQTYQVSNASVNMESAGKGKKSGFKIGGGAAAGAVIGGILGGGKGAATGAAVGAGAGAAASMLTGPQVKIPSESVLTFKVQ